MKGIRSLETVMPNEVVYPPKGGSFIGAFGEEVHRLTDETDSPSINSHRYSSKPYRSLSRDGKYLILNINGKPYLDDFNVETCASSNRRKLLAAWTGTTPYEETSIVWSAVEPNRCFFVEPAKQQIWEHNVVTDTYGVVKRFNAPELKIASIWGLTVSDNANSFGFRATLTDSTNVAITYERSTGITVIYDNHSDVHAVVMHPDGRHFRTFTSDQTASFYDMATEIGIFILGTSSVAYLNHLDWDRAWMIGGEPEFNGVAARRFERPDRKQMLWQPPLKPDGKVDWFAHHVSIADDFFMLASYNCDRSWRPFHDEIIQFYFNPRTGTPRKFRRLAHTRSFGAGGTISTPGNYVGPVNYFRQPRAEVCDVEVDGETQYIVFWTSDLGMPGNRTDVLCKKVPPIDEVQDLQDVVLNVEQNEEHLRNELDIMSQQLDGAVEAVQRAQAQRDALTVKIAAAQSSIAQAKSDLE